MWFWCGNIRLFWALPTLFMKFVCLGITVPLYLCFWRTIDVIVYFSIMASSLFYLIWLLQRWIYLLHWWLVSFWTGSFRTWRVKYVSNTFPFHCPFYPPPRTPISLNCCTLSFESLSVPVPVPPLAPVFSACPSLMRDRPHLVVVAASQGTWLAIKHWEDHPPLNCSVDQC